jgi:DNA invertase Pin-like site-specific DNA recombinase
MSEKIKGHHLERGAYVYVRQSTPQQVRNHLESKQRQYALVSRAEQLGFRKVVVIDEDLGRSGAGLQERPGFGRLLTSVCQGLAGAVLALEASRLARNIETGIIWLTYVRSQKRCWSITMASTIRVNLTTD